MEGKPYCEEDYLVSKFWYSIVLISIWYTSTSYSLMYWVHYIQYIVLDKIKQKKTDLIDYLSSEKL